MVTKKGAGGRQQPYVPAGNGEESGEYKSFNSSCLHPNIALVYNAIGPNSIIKYAYENHVPPVYESKHLEKRLKERGIQRILIAEALIKPLDVSAVHYDDKGRPSITYYGPNVTVYINPQNGSIITVHRTRKNIRNKYKEKY